MLLTTALGISLARGATMKQENGCINVLDVNVNGASRTLGTKSELFGGKSSSAKTFFLRVPETRVIRINETRHLYGLV